MQLPRPRPENPEFPFVGQMVYQDLVIDVETAGGGTRSGIDASGKAWSVVLPWPYGEFRGTKACDGDAVDVFVGPNPHSAYAWVVQAKKPGTQAFDEPKVMLGFATREAVLAAFRSAYSGPGFIMGITRWPMSALKAALNRPDLQRGRLGPQALQSVMHKGGAMPRPVVMLKGAPRPGLVLRPSKMNPRVKRWMSTEQAAAEDRAAGQAPVQPAAAAAPRPVVRTEQRSDMPTAGRPWVDSLAHLPKDTLEHYTTNGQLDPQRRKLHDKIVASFSDHIPSVPPDKKPEALVMMGGTASGKTTTTKHLPHDLANSFVHCDADAVKAHLPEYLEGVAGNARNAAFLAHEESSSVMKEIRDKAIGDRKNLLMDGTGANRDGYLQLIKRLKDKGYHVTVIMPDTDYEKALPQATGRAEKTGRWVNPEIMKGIYDKVPGNFLPIANEAHDFHLFDARSFPPRPVWSRTDGHETVHDEQFVLGFKEKHGGNQPMKKAQPPRELPRAIGGEKIANGILESMTRGRQEIDRLPARYPGNDGIAVVQGDDSIAE